jgi:hypothetical protein
MLEHLSARDFEEYCQTLLACHYQCRVDLSAKPGDEGRDLLIHHQQGLAVGECKHWPTGTVGRPVVQKLHSATLTANARRAIILTTGRFSAEAETYARNLTDVAIELMDAAKLSHCISTTFPNGSLHSNLSMALQTTSDRTFPEAFAQSVLTERYHSLNPHEIPRATRSTHYEPYYVATYFAEGSLRTAVGDFTQTWDGSLWIAAGGDAVGFGCPLSHGHALDHLVSLPQAITSVSGPTVAPVLQPHQAVTGMKTFVTERCTKYISYHGRNNVSYTGVVRPSPSKVTIHSLKLCYIPVQRFTLQFAGFEHEGGLDERNSPPLFHVTCPSLSQCVTCGTATSASSQVFCSICGRPAHRWCLLFPDSFQCAKCGALVCRAHAGRLGRLITCKQCAPSGRSLGPRWRGHCVFGAAISVLIVLLVGVSVLASLLLPAEFAVLLLPICIVVFVVGAASWIPFLCLTCQRALLRDHEVLVYRGRTDGPRLSSAATTPRPEWIYGQKP